MAEEQRTYLFMDVDGVLIKCYAHDPGYRQHWNEQIGHDLGILPGALQTHFFSKHWPDVITGKRDLAATLTEIIPKLGFGGTAQDIIASWFKTDSTLDTDLLAMLAQVKEKSSAQLYLASNQEKTRAAYLWGDLKLGQLFIDIFFSGKLGIGKPDPEFFALINRQLGLDPVHDRILFFDDDARNVEIARQAGWKAFVYKNIDDFSGTPTFRL